MVKRRYYLLIQLFIWLVFNPLPAHADPVTLTTVLVVSIIGTILSTAVGITSAVISGNAQKEQSDYQQKVNERNAAASRNAAEAKVNQQRLASKFLQGTQLAKLGGMGVTADGSTLQLLGQTAGQEKYDELVTQYEGESQAIQFEQQAALNEYQGKITDLNMGLNITSQAIKGATSVGTSLLSGGASTAVTGSVGSRAFAAGLTNSTISSGTAGYIGNSGGLS